MEIGMYSYSHVQILKFWFTEDTEQVSVVAKVPTSEMQRVIFLQLVLVRVCERIGT